MPVEGIPELYPVASVEQKIIKKIHHGPFLEISCKERPGTTSVQTSRAVRLKGVVPRMAEGTADGSLWFKRRLSRSRHQRETPALVTRLKQF